MLLTCLALFWMAGVPGCLKCPVIELPRLSKSETTARVTSRGLPLAAVHRKIVLSKRAARHWNALPEGTLVWRVAIRSPGAAGLRVHFTGLRQGAGAVWIYDGSAPRGSRLGPYLSGEDFWSDIVFSEIVVVEYRPASADKSMPFRIPEVSHLLRR